VVANETVLARLSTREVQLELSAAQARAAADRREADIARARGQPGAEMVAALAAERAEAQIALLADRIARATVRAPVDGVIVAGDMRRSLGQTVTRGQALFEIARPGDLRAEVLVLDAHAGRLAVGARVELAPAADPGRRLGARIDRVQPMAEAVQGRNVVRAIATLDVAPGLRAGMEGEARVAAGPGTWAGWLFGDLVRAVRARLWV
jgi:multidrug resistance efflux pump